MEGAEEGGGGWQGGPEESRGGESPYSDNYGFPFTCTNVTDRL